MKKIFLLLCIPFLGYAQEFKEHISNFNMTSFTYKHNEKWSAYLELQMRSIEDYMEPNYYEIKGGPAYNINKNNQVLVGFGRYGTYKDRVFNQREYRLWLQYVLSHRIDRLKLDHRWRAEKRFFYAPQTGKNTNDERYRYRLSATLPLNSKKVTEGTFYANAFEEIFVGPKNNDVSFKRNRLYAGFGYQFNDFANANLGYMWQREFSALKGNRNYHFLYFAINFTIDSIDDERIIPIAD